MGAWTGWGSLWKGPDGASGAPRFPPPQCTGLELAPLFPGLRCRGSGLSWGGGEGGQERREGEKGGERKAGAGGRKSYAAILRVRMR